MKLLLFPGIVLILSSILLSCFPKNQPLKNAAYNSSGQGYKGTIIMSRNPSCPYLLVVSGLKDTLDPINLKDFTKNEIPTKVWVTFSNLKMKNRCNQGRPVLIQTLKNRSATEQ
ncbi:hypothetical protein [Aquimarina intermedia]|uniref:Lipoprotein n=1 Tax=Aquimarina intermedia TaxID=350814 RepID=A0A5S5CCL8_9FLAO|nr:hypothetical protein [Aquimarina intermedia]TYP77077.1 hypothetical protein BD809_101225 [Aquimarina intermedia]